MNEAEVFAVINAFDTEIIFSRGGEGRREKEMGYILR